MFKAPSKRITLSEDSYFDVRGLSLSDTLAIYWRSPQELSSLFEDLVSDFKNGFPIDAIYKATSSVPDIIAQTIAFAAGYKYDDADFWEQAEKFKILPIGAQVDALNEIASLTFSSDMPPKKMLGLLLEMMSVMPTTKLP